MSQEQIDELLVQVMLVFYRRGEATLAERAQQDDVSEGATSPDDTYA